MANGVRARVDGAGDGWAQGHRQLGPQFLMQDVDAMAGVLSFTQTTENRLFLEYVPDEYAHHADYRRAFAVAALFDRKATTTSAFATINIVSTAFYLWICRALSEHQPLAAKFFYVIGGPSPPWEFVELDTTTAQVRQRTMLRENTPESWRACWQVIGLEDAQRQLRQALDSHVAHA